MGNPSLERQMALDMAELLGRMSLEQVDQMGLERVALSHRQEIRLVGNSRILHHDRGSLQVPRHHPDSRLDLLKALELQVQMKELGRKILGRLSYRQERRRMAQRPKKPEQLS